MKDNLHTEGQAKRRAKSDPKSSPKSLIDNKRKKERIKRKKERINESKEMNYTARVNGKLGRSMQSIVQRTFTCMWHIVV